MGRFKTYTGSLGFDATTVSCQQHTSLVWLWEHIVQCALLAEAYSTSARLLLRWALAAIMLPVSASRPRIRRQLSPFSDTSGKCTVIECSVLGSRRHIFWKNIFPFIKKREERKLCFKTLLFFIIFYYSAPALDEIDTLKICLLP